MLCSVLLCAVLQCRIYTALNLAAPIEQHEKRLCIALTQSTAVAHLTFSVLLHLAMFFYLQRAMFLLAFIGTGQAALYLTPPIPSAGR